MVLPFFSWAVKVFRDQSLLGGHTGLTDGHAGMVNLPGGIVMRVPANANGARVQKRHDLAETARVVP
jgi:hypothetical protein